MYRVLPKLTMASVVLEPPRRGPAVDAGDTPVQRDLRSLWPLRTVSARVVTNGTAPVELWPKQRYGTVRPTTAQPSSLPVWTWTRR